MSTENYKRLNCRQVQKNDTSANWKTASNNGFVPLKGEIIVYTDLNKIKIGDGVTTVENLEFSSAASSAEAYYFTPKYAKDNYISDVLQINIDGNCDSAYMRDGYVNESSANMQELLDIYNIRSSFLGYRQVFVVSDGSITRTTVKVTELYPYTGREYFRQYFAYYSDGSFNGYSWTSWYHRDIESFSMISFTIDGVHYAAQRDMTWAEWVNSRYNSGHEFYVSSPNIVKKVEPLGEYAIGDSSWVLATQTITNGGTYYLTEYV